MAEAVNKETGEMTARKEIVQSDPFQAMDTMDDEAFLEELKGRIVDTWAYHFYDKSTNKEVWGVSKVGVDQACREMSKMGEAIREEDISCVPDPTDQRFVLFKGFASRVLVSKDGKEVILDRTAGTKRQCVFVINKEGITNRSNPFWYEQGAMKALRNARMRLLTEEVKTKIITLSKQLGKVKTVDKGESKAAPAVEKKPAGNIGPEQIKMIEGMLKRQSLEETDLFNRFNIKSFSEITFEKMNEVLGFIRDPEAHREAGAAG